MFENFLKWLKVQISKLPSQLHLPKKQLQELLLGLGLTLRDHNFACFSEADTPLPQFIAESCMEYGDIVQIDAILKKLQMFVEELVVV